MAEVHMRWAEHIESMELYTGVWWEMRVRVRIFLGWILEKWTGLIWLRKENSVGVKNALDPRVL